MSIEFVEKGIIKFGIIYDVMKDKMFYALDKKVAYLNGEKTKVSQDTKLSDTIVATGFVYDRIEKAEYYCFLFSFFKKITRYKKMWFSNPLMAWLVSDRIDEYGEFNLKPWDVYAGKIIVEQAVGVVSKIGSKKWGTDFDSILLW